MLSSRVADTLVALMQGPVSGGGTAPGAQFGRPIAGKTGTTDNSSAVWFSGYTPQIAASVWVGDPRGGYKYPVRNTYINGRYYGTVYGATIPAPIWRSAMVAAHRDLPVKGFGAEPKYINFKFKERAKSDEETGSGNAELPDLTRDENKPEPTLPPAVPGAGEENDFLEQLKDLDFGF